MPLAFGSILGGMTTLIGTPPNLIVSGYRETMGEGGFAMFDFAPVGVSVAVVGVLFVGLIGWRLVPVRKGAQTGKFDSGVYLSEVRIVEGGKLADKRVTEADLMLEKVDAQMVAMIRRDVRISAPNPRRVLRVGDLLEIEVDPESLSSVLTELGLKLEEEVPAEDKSEAVAVLGMSPTATICMIGIRVFPKTRLSVIAMEEQFIDPQQDFLKPVFYLSQAIENEILPFIKKFSKENPTWIFPGLNINIDTELQKKLRRFGIKGPLWEYMKMGGRLHKR